MRHRCGTPDPVPASSCVGSNATRAADGCCVNIHATLAGPSDCLTLLSHIVADDAKPRICNIWSFNSWYQLYWSCTCDAWEYSSCCGLGPRHVLCADATKPRFWHARQRIFIFNAFYIVDCDDCISDCDGTSSFACACQREMGLILGSSCETSWNEKRFLWNDK